jgi:hypothetical protein
MPKRKRSENYGVPTGDPEMAPERAINMQREQLEKRMFNAKKLLQRALKTSKGFEAQKMAKRLKNARKLDDKKLVERLELEAGTLKVRTIIDHYRGIC